MMRKSLLRNSLISRFGGLAVIDLKKEYLKANNHWFCAQKVLKRFELANRRGGGVRGKRLWGLIFSFLCP